MDNEQIAKLKLGITIIAVCMLFFGLGSWYAYDQANEDANQFVIDNCQSFINTPQYRSHAMGKYLYWNGSGFEEVKSNDTK